MTLESERPTLVKYHAKRSDEERLAFMAPRLRSIDGLPTRVATPSPQTSVAASG